VPRITALTADRSGNQLLLELDGVPWRLVPVEIAVQADLATGTELGRPELRRLRRELRRGEALETAARALRYRDRSRGLLRARLADAGIAPWACEQALDTLARAGVVDDARFARNRARALADRGYGNAFIRADLAAAAVAEPEESAALGALEPERERAIRWVAARDESHATARWLARRGFGEESIEAALPTLVAD
jgi:SOS response regulatory protein OraA/RecX